MNADSAIALRSASGAGLPPTATVRGVVPVHWKRPVVARAVPGRLAVSHLACHSDPAAIPDAGPRHGSSRVPMRSEERLGCHW